MSTRNVLYLQGRMCVSDDTVEMPVQTYLSIFATICSENYSVKLCFVDLGNCFAFSIPKETVRSFCVEFISKDCFVQQELHCNLPFVQLNDNKTVVAGLCAALRWVIKDLVEKDPDHHSKHLLGFRGGCLVSCAENSLWTRFCEVEFPEAVMGIAQLSKDDVGNVGVPDCLLKLESHLKAPVRTHNISKRTHDLVKKLKKDINQESNAAQQREDQTIAVDNQSNVSEISKMLSDVKLTEEFSLKHCYLEGIDFTLTDIIVIPCVKLMFEYLSASVVSALTHVRQWYVDVLRLPVVARTSSKFGWRTLATAGEELLLDAGQNYILPPLTGHSLYSRDSTVPKGKTRNFNPTPVMSLLKINGIVPVYEKNTLSLLKWNELPIALHPSFGDLPQKRIERKCQQLENIVSAVLRIAHPNQIIVDFCSGGGHVGLLLAHFLPDCQVFLVENKEESLYRARNRSHALNLQNIKFFQCNLDYFNASFDVGVSLHACGVATDLVMKKCIDANAAFVCCPCCYGAVQEVDRLMYPLSTTFRSLPILYKDYRLLSHCADRTEINTAKVQQGIYCMGLVDTDRLLFAKEHGYNVELTKLEPVTCSPKHNLLVGVKSS